MNVRSNVGHSIDRFANTEVISRDNNCETRFSCASWMQSSLGHDTFAIYRNLLFTSIPCRHSYRFTVERYTLSVRIAGKKRTCKHSIDSFSLSLSHVPFALIATFATTSTILFSSFRCSLPHCPLSQYQTVPASNEKDPVRGALTALQQKYLY